MTFLKKSRLYLFIFETQYPLEQNHCTVGLWNNLSFSLYKQFGAKLKMPLLSEESISGPNGRIICIFFNVCPEHHFFFSPYFSNSDRILVKLISGQFWCPVMQHCLKHFFLTFYLKEERILRSLLISLRVGKMCL